MTVEAGINGFGRIGHLTLRRIQDVEGIEVVAVNDLAGVKMLAHLLKYDTTQGRLNGTVEAHGGSFSVNGKKIKVLTNRNPEELPWGELGVDIVLECTSFFTSKEAAEKHLTADAKRVVILAPGGNDVPTIAYNTNHETLTREETIISGASCATNCLAPMARALHDNFGVVKGLMTTIHAYTGDQVTLDGPHSRGDFHRARVATADIVPNSTGAAKAVGLVIPELNGRLDGAAQRVPIATGPLTGLVTVLDKEITVDEINAVMEKAANESYDYSTDKIVSSSIVGMTYGSLFNATQAKVMTADGKQLVKTVVWYDSEMSYAVQLVRTLEYFADLQDSFLSLAKFEQL